MCELRVGDRVQRTRLTRDPLEFEFAVVESFESEASSQTNSFFPTSKTAKSLRIEEHIAPQSNNVKSRHRFALTLSFLKTEWLNVASVGTGQANRVCSKLPGS